MVRHDAAAAPGAAIGWAGRMPRRFAYPKPTAILSQAMSYLSHVEIGQPGSVDQWRGLSSRRSDRSAIHVMAADVDKLVDAMRRVESVVSVSFDRGSIMIKIAGTLLPLITALEVWGRLAPRA